MFAADSNQNICGPCGCSGCPLIKPAEECIVSRVGEACPQFTLKSMNRLTADQADLEENFIGTFEDCVAHVETLFGRGAGYAKYWNYWDNTNRRWVGKCESWVVRNCVAHKVAPATCPSVAAPVTIAPITIAPVTAAPAPVTPPTANTAADADVHCIRADGSRFVNQCVLDMFAADPNQNICGPCGCSGCPLIKPAEECIVPRVGEACPQFTLKSMNRLTPEQAALEENFIGTFEDCVAHVETLFGRGAGYAKYWKHWDNANRRWVGKCESWVVRNCVAPKVAPATCPSVNAPVTNVPVTIAPVTTAPAPVTTPSANELNDEAVECILPAVG